MAGFGLHDRLIEAALAEGFPCAGGVDIVPVLGDGLFREHVAKYDAWIADGRQGAMSYLDRGRDRRADPRVVLPGAQSVFCVLKPYPAQPAGNPDPAKGPRYARYLRTPDYHRELAEGLERVMARAIDGDDPIRWKVCVDTSAVLERTWAMLAGLGWIGKNTMLIHPQLGSYTFIGAVLIDRELDARPRPIPDYCGNCERCMTACPTSAFADPRVLDSRRCISYLTLEKRGEWDLPKEVLAKTGAWIAGCDVCQEVCPFNTKAAKGPVPPRGDPAIDVTQADTWGPLLMEMAPAYQARVSSSAMKRIKYAEFQRNLRHARSNTEAAPIPGSEG